MSSFLNIKADRMPKVATTVIATIAVPRQALWTWLVPGVFYNELESVVRDEAGLPGCTKTTGTTGPWDVAGSTRIVHLSDETCVRETVKVATAPDYFAYRLTDFSSAMIRLLVREAGGFAKEIDGGDFLQTGSIVVANERLLPLLTKAIRNT